MADKDGKQTGCALSTGSILPPPPAEERPTLQVPRAQTDAEVLRNLLAQGPSPTTAEWPEAPPHDPLTDSGEWRPTPPAFVVPEIPGQGVATLTQIRGRDAGRVFRLERPRAIVGRGVTSDVQLDDPAVSRCHASITRVTDDRYLIEDLGSTNGTFVRGRLVGRSVLSPGDRIQLGPNVAFRFALLTDDEGTLQDNLFKSAVRDSLTGLFNRISLTRQLEDAVLQSSERGGALSVLMIDLDHFKLVNDELGHAAGDETLRVVAAEMMRVVRARDSVGRHGGEEFVIVARATARAEACQLAERLRKAIASLRVPTERGTARTTASIGVAALSECRGCTASDLLQLADERMYEAKRLGRNCVWPS